jgi:hypothetical protein
VHHVESTITIAPGTERVALTTASMSVILSFGLDGVSTSTAASESRFFSMALLILKMQHTQSR